MRDKRPTNLQALFRHDHDREDQGVSHRLVYAGRADLSLWRAGRVVTPGHYAGNAGNSAAAVTTQLAPQPTPVLFPHLAVQDHDNQHCIKRTNLKHQLDVQVCRSRTATPESVSLCKARKKLEPRATSSAEQRWVPLWAPSGPQLGLLAASESSPLGWQRHPYREQACKANRGCAGDSSGTDEGPKSDKCGMPAVLTGACYESQLLCNLKFTIASS